MLDYTKIIEESKFKDLPLDYPDPVITINDRVICTVNSFITLNGLPKSRKTTFMQFFIASALLNSSIFGIKVKLDPTELMLLIDTEQSLYDFSRQIKSLKKMIGTNTLPDNFESYLFRQYDPDIILNSIYTLIKDKKPKIVFIDNLTELVLNFNDPTESKKLVQFLKKLTAEFNIVIVCLLHLGKGNLQSLGNLGSYTDRSANSVLKVIADKDTQTSTLEASLLRSDYHFDPITIGYDHDINSYIQVNKPIEKPKKFDLGTMSIQDHITKINLIFERYTDIQYNQLVEELKIMYGIGYNIVKQKLIPYLQDQKILKAVSRGIYIKLTI